MCARKAGGLKVKPPYGLIPAWVELPRFGRHGAVYEDVLPQRSVEPRRERVALEPVVNRHVQVARLSEGLDLVVPRLGVRVRVPGSGPGSGLGLGLARRRLDLVVPVGGQHEGIARLDLDGEDARISVEGVPPG